MLNRWSLTLWCMVVPAALSAQGRLIAPRCPDVRQPPCPDCATTMVVPSCGPDLARLSSTVKVGLADRVLRYEVTETFVNRGSRVAEADYVFPLPAGAAFEDLKLSINGELVSGETMSADKARGIYEEIVRRQRDPALVEWMGSGMLRTRIFPINPGEEKKVVVRFQSVATREGDALRVDYRRGSDPTAGPNVRRGDDHSSSRDEAGPWTTFALLYPRSAELGEPYSPTHTLQVKDDGRTRQVEARGSASTVTVLLPLRRPNAASISVLTHAPEAGPGFALFRVTPPATSRRTLPRDVTFVVDVSGSMSGQKLVQAKQAGRALLNSLREGDRFRIVDFSTDVRAFRDGWTDVTNDALREARRYVDDLRAEGSTNISGALEEALRTRSSGGRLPLVVFVTDGEPTVGERNPERIADLAAQRRGDARVFAVGISADVNATLIEQLATEGRGTAHFLRNEESVERAVSLLASRLSSPVMTNVQLQVDGVRLSRVLPAAGLDVFAGQDLVVLARYEGNGSARVRLVGESPDGPVDWTTTARFPARERDNPFVARLWAAQRIGWLAAEKRRSGGNAELDGEIRSLGERYGIPTEFSSYLVVEPGMQLARQDAPSSRAIDQAGAGGRLRDRTTTATGGAVAAAPAPMRSNEARFEAARAAAKQREAKSAGELDEAERASGSRRVGARLFNLANGVWTDAQLTPSLRRVSVKPYSQAYFDLMQKLDELAPVFALGDRVVVGGQRVAIELAPTGVERLGVAELGAIVRDW